LINLTERNNIERLKMTYMDFKELWFYNLPHSENEKEGGREVPGRKGRGVVMNAHPSASLSVCDAIFFFQFFTQ
jgi:hypothetical protein